jgi:hypothetical protein
MKAPTEYQYLSIYDDGNTFFFYFFFPLCSSSGQLCAAASTLLGKEGRHVSNLRRPQWIGKANIS